MIKIVIGKKTQKLKKGGKYRKYKKFTHFRFYLFIWGRAGQENKINIKLIHNTKAYIHALHGIEKWRSMNIDETIIYLIEQNGKF